MPLMSTYVVDNGADTEVVESADLVDVIRAMHSRPVTVTRLELLRDYDHGSRAADELSMTLLTDLATLVMDPLMSAMHGQPLHGDALAAALANIGATGEWNGSGWAPYRPGADYGQWTYELADAVEAAATDAGLIIDSSADGATWVYRAR